MSRVLEWLAGLALGRFRAFYGAMVLGFGGIALLAGWNAGPQKWLDQRRFATLTAQAPARIVERWLAVEFDPSQIGKAPDWRAFAKASPCIVVEYGGDWSRPLRRAFCGTKLDFHDHYRLDDLRETSPGVPFSWARDERGFVAPEIRVSAAGKRYLDTHVAEVVARPQDIPAGAELTSLREHYDRPVDYAIAGWGRAEPAFTVDYDPAQPELAWPAGFVHDDRRRAPDAFSGGVGLLLGIFIWVVGWSLVMGGGEGSRARVAIISAVTLLALPWWGNALPRVLAGMNAPFASIIADMSDTVGALDRLEATTPAEATLAGGARIVWHAGDDVYAATVASLPLRLPDPLPADDDAALDALAATVARHVASLDAAGRAALFAQLSQDKREGRARAGFLFTRAARDAMVDAGGDPGVRREAERFLDAWVTQPVEEPWPADLAFATRIALLRELMAIPEPRDIGVRAGWVVERAEARKADPALHAKSDGDRR